MQVPSTRGSRRSRRGVLAAACIGAVSALSGATAGAAPSGTLTFGSNGSDAIPKAAYQALVDAFKAENPGLEVAVNTSDHNKFQEGISQYVQGTPDDVFTWFAGYRMQSLSSKGLVGDISDVWTKLSSDQPPAFKGASTAADGKQYFVPLYNYPWGVFYRKSVFKSHGYKVPKTLDQLVTLSKKMQKDGLTPIAFGDKDGWPALGTFDYLNERINGYDFHVSLMAGKQSWTDPKVKKVFETWKTLLPYHSKGSLGRTWQEAAKSVVNKKAGMYLLGAFVGQQFTGASNKDLDFFAFPQINPKYGTDTVEAPIDGLMLAKDAKNPEAAKAFLAFAASAKGQQIYLGADANSIATSKSADTSKYTPLQKKSVGFIASAKHISQFLDRDTEPAFANTVMIPAIQSFIKNPNDIDGLLKGIEKQKQVIFAK